jgi:hypothetical protein
MNYPLISEYIEAIKSAEDNFEELSYLIRPVLGDDGLPVMTSGNFAVVFKMKDEQSEKFYAVKCFTKEQEGRAEAYREITKELKDVSSPYLTSVRYLDKELFVDTDQTTETEFPVLLMDWLEGKTLDKYLRENLDDKYALEMLAYRFSQLAQWLIPQPFAHGDLKPDNILVREDGTLVLVDYDGMYVPAMKGQKARELGSPDFRHPIRTENDFNKHIDDFSLVSILLSLKAISLQPSLLEEYGASYRLLFSEQDYHNLSENKTLEALRPQLQDAELASLYSLFILALSQNNLSQVSFRLFNLSRPEKPQFVEENLSTKVTDEDLVNAWTDEYGVMYSADKKRLLKATRPLYGIDYKVRNGVIIVCDYSLCRKGLHGVSLPDSVTSIGNGAFQSCIGLTCITIPDGVTSIGNHAFSYCFSLTSITIPDSVISIGDRAFSDCHGLISITIPDSVTSIGNGAFDGCNDLTEIIVNTNNAIYDSRNNCNAIIETCSNALAVGCKNSVIPDNVTSIGNRAFSGCRGLTSITIPDSVTSIGSYAFDDCSGLTCITIPDSVTSIGNEAFSSCRGLTSITIPDSMTSIGSYAFYDCSGLTSITISDSVTRIGDGAFSGCRGLTSITIPNSVTSIGNAAFQNCSNLTSITIPDGVTTIGNYAFCGCRGLTSITIPDSVTSIGSYAFNDCSGLTCITIPDSVTSIGDEAFSECSNLTCITIPDGVTSIGNEAFRGCFRLTSITIPGSVTSIGDEAFRGCFHLTNITIPDGVTTIGSYAFYDCRGLTSITIPASMTSIGSNAFSDCSGLTSITILDSVTSIGNRAFLGCTSLTKIRVPYSARDSYMQQLPMFQNIIEGI